MIRLAALWLAVTGLAVYAKKDWYVSLCGLILMMAVIEHPDVPKTMFGIQGLNFWNCLLFVVVVAWLAARRREGLTWDMPAGVNLLLLAYLGVVCVAFVRMLLDRRYIDEMSTATLVSEYLVNTLKWVVPGMLLFDGCRSLRRFQLGLASILGVYLLLGLYVIKWMPLSLLSNGDALQERSLKILVNEIGYHRVTMSMMLAGASWAFYSTRTMVPRRYRVFMIAAMGAIVLAQALTGGRMGYVTWAVLGVGLLAVRDRAALLLAPLAVGAVLLIVPAAGERLMQGFDASSSVYLAADAARRGVPVDGSAIDLNTVTAGRTLIWPYVEDKILDAPVLGYGMLAMRRTGLTTFLQTTLSEGFDHPHNAYFEMLLDNGLVGFMLVVPFYGLIMWRAFRLYADGRSRVFIAAGGVTLALVASLLVAGIGSQSFYPREAAVGMWCAIGLMFRVWVERERIVADAPGAADSAPALPPVIRWPEPDKPAVVTTFQPGPSTAVAARSQVSLDDRLWRAS